MEGIVSNVEMFGHKLKVRVFSKIMDFQQLVHVQLQSQRKVEATWVRVLPGELRVQGRGYDDVIMEAKLCNEGSWWKGAEERWLMYTEKVINALEVTAGLRH